MLFMTITFTFPSLDVVFLPAQLWWHSLGSCQHPLVPSPRAGAPALGRCLTPSLFLTPPSQPLPPGETEPLLHYLSSQQFVPSTRQLYLPAAMFVQASRGLDKPAVQTCCCCCWRWCRGERIAGWLQRGPEANLSPFIPASSPLLHHLGST